MPGGGAAIKDVNSYVRQQEAADDVTTGPFNNKTNKHPTRFEALSFVCVKVLFVCIHQRR